MKFWKEASRRALPALLALALCFGMLPVAAAGGEAADIKAGHASGLAVPNMGAGSGAFSPQTFKNLLKVRIELVFREILHQ